VQCRLSPTQSFGKRLTTNRFGSYSHFAPLGRLSLPQQGRNKFPSFGGVRGGLLWLEQSFYVAISSDVQVA
jgi:hypothetical protein